MGSKNSNKKLIPVRIEQVLKTSRGWTGALLPGFSLGQTEFRVLTFKIAPGGMTTLHMHPLNGAGYMISGELTMFATDDPHGSFANDKKIKKIKLTAGDAWAEIPNVWHYGKNTGQTEVIFVLIFAGQEGTPPTLSLGTQAAHSPSLRR